MSATKKKLLFGVVVLGLVLVVVLRGELRTWLIDVIAAVQDLGPLGGLLFVLLYIVATVAALPASLLTIAAGIVYGPYWAGALVLFASVSGATLAFALARSWLRPWVQSRYGDGMAFRTIAARTEKDGAKLVFLLRLSPVVPFSILNYLLGITGVSLRGYVLASIFGMLPGIFLYTHIGSTLGSLSELTSGAAVGGGLSGVVFWVGLGATLAVTIVLGRWSALALRPRAEDQA